MKKIKFCISLILVCLVCDLYGQLSDPGRGMYVDKFFRTTINSSGATVVDAARSILTITAKENALLQYAKDNHITYLVLYDLHRVLGTSYETNLCNFIHKAKNSYCISLIGMASACSSLFDDAGIAVPTPPYILPQFIQSNPLSFVQNTYSTSDVMFYRSETAKLNLRAVDFNDFCADKIDVFVTEYEFWNGAAFHDNCTDEANVTSHDKWPRFQTLVDDMDQIRDDYNNNHSHTIYCEAYLGYLDNDDASGIQNDQIIADWIDGIRTGHSTRRFDRVNTHYYTSDATKAYSRTTTGQNFQGYYNKRFLDFCQNTTNNQTNLHPIFSTEYLPWGGASNYLPYWINQDVHNNIFTAEKIWYDQWYDDATNFSTALVGNSTLGNVVQPGGVQYFTSSYMVDNLAHPLMFLSNSPICVPSNGSATPTFEYLGPIEDGLQFIFYITDQGSTNVRCGSSSNSITWNPYVPATQTSIDLNTALGGCSLGTGDYDAHLELTYSTGCTYVVPVVPIHIGTTAQIVALTNTTVCQGEPVFLQASTSSTGVTSYQWRDGTSPVGTNSSYYAPFASATGTHNYSCIVTNASGCSANPSNIIPVTIVTFPVASISTQSHTNCIIVLQANPTGMNYQWHDNSNGATYSTNLSGSYSVTVSDPTAGCSRTASFTYQKPKISLGMTIKSCFGSSTGQIPVTITAGTPSYAPYNLNWSGPVIGNVANVGLTYNITNLSTGSYVVTVTDADGCTKTASTSVTSNNQITANTSSTPASCQSSFDGSATVSNPSGGTAPYSFHWHFNNATTNIITGLQSGTYDVDIIDNIPCTTTVSVVVNNNSLSVLPSVVIAGPSSICAGATATFTATPTNGGTPSYQWKVNGTNVGTNSASFLSSSITNNQTVTCVITSTALCANPTSVPSNGIQVTVLTISTPSILIAQTIGTNPMCAGASAIFTATPVNGGSGPNYQWKLDGNIVGTNSSTYTTTSLTNGQIVTCELTSNAQCASPATVTSNIISLVVNPIPTISPATFLSICENASSFTLTGFTPTGGTYSGNGVSGGMFDPSSVSGAGTYTITYSYTDSHGCINSANSTISVNQTQPAATFTLESYLVGNESSIQCGTSADVHLVNLIPSQYGTNPIVEWYYTDGTGPHLAHTTSFNTDGINWNQYSYQNVPCNGWSGVYAILYPDADACPTASMVTSGSLTISDFTGITGEYVYAVNTNPTCPSSSNGSINIELHENWNGISLVKDFGSYTINNVTHNIPVATSYLITGLSSGSYSISINGHSFNTNLVSSHINPSPSITNGYNGFDCSAQLSTGAFATYFWYDLSGTITGNSQSFTAPSSSVYTVEVTDQYGCSGSATQIVNLNISSTISGIHSTCGSTYSVPLIGNNALYNWTVPSGANYTPNSSGNIITVNWGSALNIGGTLSCSVSNACGLSSSSSIQVSPYIATTTATQSCIGINNGSAGVISAGGTPPYSYHWNSGTNTTAALMSNLAAGTYTVTVTDANSCTATASATVSYLPTNIPTPVISGAQSASPGAHTYTITNYNSSYNNYYSWNAIANSGSATISYPNGNKQTASISWPASGGHVDVSFGITGCLQTKTYYVQPYCTGTYTYNDASQSDVTSASIITRSNMLFNGVLTITNDFSFTNCGQVSFGSGAKIIVASGKSLTIDNCTFSPGTCCRMWQGIELEPGAKIFVKNGSYISQAEYGIKVNNGSVFEIYDSHFRDNYVSLQIGTGVSTTITGSVLKNTDFYSDPYTCSGTTYNNFLPKYEGQLTTPAQLPLAGIVANNMTFFKFGNTPIAGGDVRFNNLLNGVISSNSVFHIQNTTFKNMIGGCGISAKTGTIKLRGMGNNFANSENVFENCRYGVFAQDCNLDISLVKSTNDVITGIYFSDCQTVTIKDNSISARINGIHSYHNPNSNVNIENNNIHMSGIPSGNACIRLDEFNIGHPLNVSNNDLYMNLCKYGILTYSMHKAVIKENYIQMNNVFNSSGISCYFSQGNTFQCNTIDALQHYNSAQAGITLSLSPENRVTCNWMNNQYNGIRINGACNPVVLEGNIFNNHNFGLSLAYNGLMGNQVNNGNQWNGTYTSYGAYLSGINTNSALANQIFYYDPSGANIPPTTNNDIMNLGWFAGNLNAKEFDCSNYDCQPFIPLGDDSRSEDEIIANNDDLGSEYVDPSNYFADRFLFERLLKNPELMQNNVILQAFYDQKIYGTIGQFSEMNQEIQDAVKWETVYQMVYATNENLIINAADSLSILDSLLANGYTGGSKADNLNSKMATLAASNDALKATIEQIQDYRLSNSIDDNADIVVSDSYEENEAAVNNIYMTVLESGEYSLSQQQAASLQLISEQCPFSGGPSVYMARSLYHMADAQADWDDDAICIYNGIPPRLRKPENLYNIYPNPTTGVITLNYMMLPEETGLLEIYNSLGVLLSITKLNPENHQVEVDLSYLSPALYHYKIIQNNEPIKKGMISIIR